MYEYPKVPGCKELRSRNAKMLAARHKGFTLQKAAEIGGVTGGYLWAMWNKAFRINRSYSSSNAQQGG